MELPSNIVEQIAFNTRPKIEEHKLIVMNKSTHEEQLSQPLQTNIKQYKIAVTFLTGYNGIFNITDNNNKFYFMKSITDEGGYIKINILNGSYQIKSRLHSTKHKPKIKLEVKINNSKLPPSLQPFKQKLLSGNGFVEYKQFFSI